MSSNKNKKTKKPSPRKEEDINEFSNISTKDKNDESNKKREYVINDIINSKIPDVFLQNPEWVSLVNELFKFIDNLCAKNGINRESIKCISKGGRKFNYDFLIIVNSDIKLPIEFKYNIKSIAQAPQFVSPGKPSAFFKTLISFELFFYENHLPLIATKGNLQMPEQSEYIKTINNDKVSCMEEYKKLYDNDKEFNKFSKQVSKNAINDFLKTTQINLEILTEYLKDTQKEKIYMLYDPPTKRFYDEKMNEDLYTVTDVVKIHNGNSVICITKSGMKLSILLRFKNGNGIQFPALQISRKIPTVPELKKLCAKNDIKAPKLKKDLCKVLDDNNIIY